jgi:hypothetical protein
MRAPRCLWSLTVDKSVFVSIDDSGEPVMYFVEVSLEVQSFATGYLLTL